MISWKALHQIFRATEGIVLDERAWPHENLSIEEEYQYQRKSAWAPLKSEILLAKARQKNFHK